MSPLKIASLALTGLGAVATIASCIVEGKIRDQEIAEQVQKVVENLYK